MNKQILAKIEDFEPYATFCKLDVLQKGYLTFQDVGLFMQNNWCYSDERGQLDLDDAMSINLDLWKVPGKITYPVYFLTKS